MSLTCDCDDFSTQVLDNHVIDYKSPEEWALMKSCKRSEAEKGYGAVFVGAVSASPLEVKYIISCPCCQLSEFYLDVYN